MFTEILKVKPVLDKAAAKNIETSLNSRFRRVATNFSKGMRDKFKLSATAMGAALAGALGAAMLNPIKEVEEKVKQLLDLGAENKMTAEDLGTTAGKLMQLQAVSKAKGLDVGTLNNMLENFQTKRLEAQEKKALGQSLSADEVLLTSLSGDTIDAFYQLNRSLKEMDLKDRSRITNEVLGGQQRGATKRFLESDWNQEIRNLGIPGQNVLNASTNKLDKMAARDRQADVRRELNEYVNTARHSNLGAIVDTGNKREDAQAERIQNQMDAYKNLSQVRDGVDKVSEGIDKIVSELGTAIPTMVKGFQWITSGGMKEDLKKMLMDVGKALNPFSRKN